MTTYKRAIQVGSTEAHPTETPPLSGSWAIALQNASTSLLNVGGWMQQCCQSTWHSAYANIEVTVFRGSKASETDSGTVKSESGSISLSRVCMSVSLPAAVIKKKAREAAHRTIPASMTAASVPRIIRIPQSTVHTKCQILQGRACKSAPESYIRSRDSPASEASPLLPS